MKHALTPWVMGCTFLVSACSDDIKTVGDNTDGPQTWDVRDITGTWDLTGSVSDIGESVTGTLTIEPEVFSLELGSVFVHYSPDSAPELQVRPSRGDAYGQGQAREQEGREVSNFDVTRETNEPIDLGVIPLRIGGRWYAEEMSGKEECQAFARRGTIAGACQPILSGWDYGAFAAEQLERSSSIFGDLGGTWNVHNYFFMTGGCTAILRGTTFIAQCAGTGESTDGKITFTMQDGFGSGSSDEGLEISAVRRR
jgi:hypothetical protein